MLPIHPYLKATSYGSSHFRQSRSSRTTWKTKKRAMMRTMNLAFVCSSIPLKQPRMQEKSMMEAREFRISMDLLSKISNLAIYTQLTRKTSIRRQPGKKSNSKHISKVTCKCAIRRLLNILVMHFETSTNCIITWQKSIENFG